MHRSLHSVLVLLLSFVLVRSAHAQQQQASMLTKEQVIQIAGLIAQSNYGRSVGVVFDTGKPEFRDGIWSFKPLVNRQDSPDAPRHYFEIRDWDTSYRVGVSPDFQRPKIAGDFQMSKEMLLKIKRILHPSLYAP